MDEEGSTDKGGISITAGAGVSVKDEGGVTEVGGGMDEGGIMNEGGITNKGGTSRLRDMWGSMDNDGVLHSNCSGGDGWSFPVWMVIWKSAGGYIVTDVDK